MHSFCKIIKCDVLVCIVSAFNQFCLGLPETSVETLHKINVFFIEFFLDEKS